MTAGSRSTNTARGTCFPEPVSLKKVLKESSPPPMVLSLGILPSGWMPCSKQYNSQHALPICTPAWPTWMEMHSRCAHTQCKKKKEKKWRQLKWLLTHHSGLQVHKYGPRYMVAWAACIEEGVEGVLTGIRQWCGFLQHTVRSHTMLQTEELPARVTYLNASLAHMDWDALSL